MKVLLAMVLQVLSRYREWCHLAFENLQLPLSLFHINEGINVFFSKVFYLINPTSPIFRFKNKNTKLLRWESKVTVTSISTFYTRNKNLSILVRKKNSSILLKKPICILRLHISVTRIRNIEKFYAFHFVLLGFTFLISLL